MLPRSLVLWTTTDCNLRCIYCYANGGARHDYMSFETAKRAIEKLGYGPLKVQFAGGEPTMNLGLIESVCSYLNDRDDISFSIQTNGTLMDSNFVKLVKKYNISIGISMDGIFSINEIQRGGTKNLIEGIYRLKAENIFVNINAVVTNESIEKLTELYDMALVMGNVKGIALDLIRDVGRAKSSFAQPPTLEQADKIIHTLYNHSKAMERAFGKQIVIRELEDAAYRLKNKLEIHAYCYAELGRSYVITPWGDVYPCGSTVGDMSKKIGNVNDKVWKNVCLKRKPKTECIDCEFSRYCVGVCPQRMIMDDNFLIDCRIKYNAFKIAKMEIDLEKGI